MLMFPRHLEGGDGGAGEGSALEDGDHSLRVNPRGEGAGEEGKRQVGPEEARQGRGCLSVRGQRPEGRRHLTSQ